MRSTTGSRPAEPRLAAGRDRGQRAGRPAGSAAGADRRLHHHLQGPPPAADHSRASTFVGSIAIGQLIYSGEIRHWGINFVAFVAALWIERRWNPVSSLAALALLGISAVAGVAISVQQSQLTFSEAGPTARWIRDNGLANDALVMTPDTMAAPVAVYLGKPAYYLDCSCIDSFMFYHNRRDPFHESQIPARLARAVAGTAGQADPVRDERCAHARSGERDRRIRHRHGDARRVHQCRHGREFLRLSRDAARRAGCRSPKPPART